MFRHIAINSRFTSTNIKHRIMPAFTLYGARGSSNTDRVRLTLAEGGFTDYDLVMLNLQKGDQKSKEHLHRHPWGKVPAVVFPDGFTLYESRAICQYLSQKYSFSTLPSDGDLEAAALFNQAQSVEMLYFAEPAGKIGFEKFVKKFLGLTTDEAVVAASLKAVEDFLDVAEGMLKNQEWMAGKQFTLVDIYYVPMVQRLFACGYRDVVFKNRNAVKAWWDRVVARPGIAKLIAADQEAAAAAQK